MTPKFTYAQSLVNSLTKEYFEAKSSYRDLARKHGIDKKRINDWVKDYSANCKNTIDVVKELNPRWTGYLTVDGKLIRYRGRKGCMYIGVDNCGDIVHVSTGDGWENKSNWSKFFQELRCDICYELIAMISDGNPDILASCLIYYKYFIYQTCIYHFLKRIDRVIGYSVISRYREESKRPEMELRCKIHHLLYLNTISEFMLSYVEIMDIFNQGRYRGMHCFSMVELLKNNLRHLIPHYLDKQIPRTSNLAEIIIKQYQRRLKTIEGFQSSNGFKDYLNVFTMFLRFKKYTDCRGENKYRNGRNRLELAGVDTAKIDWFTYSIKK